MFRGRTSRVLTVVAFPLVSLVAVHFVHARGKPEADAQVNAPLGPGLGLTHSTHSTHDTAEGEPAALGDLPAQSARPAETDGASGSAHGANGANGDGAGRLLGAGLEAAQAPASDDEDPNADGREAEPKVMRVLLVGNSYTMHHSLHTLLQRLAARVEGGPRMTVDAVARGGYSLSNHLRTGQALARIRAGHYTHVVLQGHSMSAVDHPDKLIADAKRFKQAIDAAAGQTVFYATWARSPEVRMYRTHKSVRSFAQMSMLVSSTYFELSSLLGAGLAPVGSAFERALVEHPRLPLWGSDGSHPSLAGSYMAACVLYGAITGIDPSLSSYIPHGLKPADAAVVRAVAARSLAATRTAANTELTTAGPFLGPT